MTTTDESAALEAPRRGAVSTTASWDGKKIILGGIFIIVLLAFTVLFIYPLIWLLFASVKPGPEVFSSNLLPTRWEWDNYPS